MPAHSLGNVLRSEPSLHLQQHANSKVAWQVWGDEAFAQAVQLQRPVLLSIGYSACHWCQNMLRESFLDEETAATLNANFVCIKVDREERPDLDDVYQIAHQLLTGQPGGWPLTMFLCPKTRLPFIAGTYYPKTAVAEVMTFGMLLSRVSVFYQSKTKEFSRLRTQVRRGYEGLHAALSAGTHSLQMNGRQVTALRESALASLLLDADTYEGGFGQSLALHSNGAARVKFPMPLNLQRLLSSAGSRDQFEAGAAQHAFFTLAKMAHGGLQDHIQGGFFRYATDSEWHIPHFEKLLGDNALMLSAYVRAIFLCEAAALPQEVYETAARGVVSWLSRTMLSPEGAFYSALNADYNDLEGDYYLWDKSLLLVRLSAIEKSLVSRLFKLDGSPNFRGKWHLIKAMSDNEAFLAEGYSWLDGKAILDGITSRWMNIRQQAVLPTVDKKILCSSNALMIASLSEMALVMNDLESANLAQSASDFLAENLWRNKRLSAVWQAGEARFMGGLNDYVYFMSALMQLLQVQWRDSDYRLLLNLAQALLDNFEDEDEGGFFSTAHDHESLIHRDKPIIDSALPSGNGMAAKVLVRLSHLAAEPHYFDSALKTVQWAGSSIQKHAQLYHNLLVAHEELVRPLPLVLLNGGELMHSWQREIQQHYGDKVQCFLLPSDSELQPPAAMGLDENQGLVCFGGHCLSPRNDLPSLLSQLQQGLYSMR